MLMLRSFMFTVNIRFLIAWLYPLRAGFGVLITLMPVQGAFGKRFGALRRKAAALTDERVRNMSEIVGGIRLMVGLILCWVVRSMMVSCR